MASILEFIEKIQSQIQSMQQSIQDIQASWQKFNEFWDLFFTIVPWEVILLLIFSVILLSLLNSVSPATPKLNLTASVSLLSVVWYYLWSVFSTTASFWVVGKAALYILLPLHFLGIMGFVVKFIQRRRDRKRKIHPKDWNSALGAISKDFHEFLALAYSFPDLQKVDRDQMAAKLSELESSLNGIRNVLAPKPPV